MEDHKAGSVTVPLKFPVMIDGIERSALTLRRPKVRDLRAMSKIQKDRGDGEAEIQALAHLCEVSPEQLDDVDGADYRRLQEAFAGFFKE